MREHRDGDVRFWETDSIDEHVHLIQRQVLRSLEDPETHELARRIVRNEPGPRGTLHAFGATFKIPPGDTDELDDDGQIALTRIWNFVAVNWSYIEDPPGFDLFAHIKYGMNAREHAKRLRSTLGSIESADTRQQLEDHIARLERVRTPGAGDCDDGAIVFGALLKAAGFRRVHGRVVSVASKNFEHIYTMAGLPMRLPTKLVALDPTVNGAVPGWEYPRSKVVVDFEL